MYHMTGRSTVFLTRSSSSSLWVQFMGVSGNDIACLFQASNLRFILPPISFSIAGLVSLSSVLTFADATHRHSAGPVLTQV